MYLCDHTNLGHTNFNQWQLIQFSNMSVYAAQMVSYGWVSYKLRFKYLINIITHYFDSLHIIEHERIYFVSNIKLWQNSYIYISSLILKLQYYLYELTERIFLYGVITLDDNMFTSIRVYNYKL